MTAALYLKSSSAFLSGRQWPPRYAHHPGVAVGLDEVMTLQPRLIGNMRPGGRRPPPAGKVSLSTVGGRLPEGARPAEVNHLCGDASKAKKVLGWTPKVNFKQLVEMMVDADLNQLKQTLVGRTANAGV